jgi:HPt (histidine-containing phosphotransfer) domain-containing protein
MQDLNDDQSDKFIVYLDSEIREIIPVFLEHRTRDVQTIRAALAEKDFEAVQVLGHKMKGTGSGYGFDGISEIGGKLEQAAKNLDLPTIQELINKLAYYLDNIEIIWVETAEDEEA